MDESAIKQRVIGVCQNELGLDDGAATDVAFHMTDWLAALERFHQFAVSPHSQTDKHVAEILVGFLTHVPNHVAAAAKLATGIGVADIFDVGAVEVDEECDVME